MRRLCGGGLRTLPGENPAKGKPSRDAAEVIVVVENEPGAIKRPFKQ